MKKTSSVLLIFALVALVGAASASAQGVLFVKNGKVGVLEQNPFFPLEVNGTIQTKRTDGGTASISFKRPTQEWIFFNNGSNGNFEIYDTSPGATPFTIENGAPAQLLRLTAAGQIKVKGVVAHADYVFEPDYALETIEEHADYMWENKHLPAIGPGTYDEDGTPYVDLGADLTGIVEELEKAHVYIEQLSKRLAELEAELANQ